MFIHWWLPSYFRRLYYGGPKDLAALWCLLPLDFHVKSRSLPEKGENIKVHVFLTRSAVGTNISTFNQEGCGNYELEQ